MTETKHILERQKLLQPCCRRSTLPQHHHSFSKYRQLSVIRTEPQIFSSADIRSRTHAEPLEHIVVGFIFLSSYLFHDDPERLSRRSISTISAYSCSGALNGARCHYMLRLVKTL